MKIFIDLTRLDLNRVSRKKTYGHKKIVILTYLDIFRYIEAYNLLHTRYIQMSYISMALWHYHWNYLCNFFLMRNIVILFVCFVIATILSVKSYNNMVKRRAYCCYPFLLLFSKIIYFDSLIFCHPFIESTNKIANNQYTTIINISK